MRPRRLAEVAVAAGGRLLEPGAESVVATGVAIDSRSVTPGDLFVALSGEHSDGHRYVGSALSSGAAGAIVQSGFQPEAWRARIIETDDPGTALLGLARDERSAIDGTVVGVTGSAGKTCTKDFIAAVCERRFRTIKSPASFNNEVGLPLTILSVPEDVAVLVCEMGARGRGHIALLCDVARPSIGVVTNVGVAHLGLFGSVEALREAKGELPASLPANGTAVLNADDPVVSGYAGRTRAEVLTYGLSPSADVRAEEPRLDRGTGRPRFVLVTGGERVDVALSVPGAHMVPNALAAAAVGIRMGISPEECATALAEAEVTAGRMEVFETAAGIRVVNDAYNANPASMAAALRAARWMAGDGRCLAVLGVMAELGPISDQEHERIGELLARLGIDELVVVGEQAGLIAVGAEREGVEPDRIHRCDVPEEVPGLLRSMAKPGDLILVKGSRVTGLQHVADGLRDLAPDGSSGVAAESRRASA
ncbi:MAG TPA: UDP-N-acetylmuramoyl-tripeptide--D-alanyl-D-alanine ligase [Actinomycetota bacterium]|nr:UDP-N-acetylmuramoyl-tripeptide--D-alanyl-D-alanine ligase [Actinomycetota bacterium]